MNKDERLTFKKIFEALEAGAKGAITVAVACAIAGMIAGCITVTGLASILINAIVQLAGSATFIGLILTMVCCIVLGMGVPTTANYCIMASTCAPILIKMGFPLVAAHFFVFYFGIVADIIASSRAGCLCGLSDCQGQPHEDRHQRNQACHCRVHCPVYLRLQPRDALCQRHERLGGYPDRPVGAFRHLRRCSGSEGLLLRKMNWLYRIVCLVGGLGLMTPAPSPTWSVWSWIGGVFVIQYLQNKKEREIA